MKIYCAHAYGGKEENKQDAEKKILQLQIAHPENTYFSPIHAFGFSYYYMSYDDGMDMCFDLLECCDEVYVLSPISEGVKREIAMAERLHIPVKVMYDCF